MGATNPLVLESGIVATKPLVLKKYITKKLGATNPLVWKVELETTKPLVVLGLQTH